MLAGFTTLGELDGDDEPYRWHVFTVFQRQSDGEIFYGEDGGCSCNYAWEDAKLSDLTQLTSETWAEFQRELEGWLEYESDHLKAEGVGLMRDVSKVLGWPEVSSSL